MVSTGQFFSAGTFGRPGFIRRWCATGPRSVGIPASERVRGRVGKVWSGETRAASSAFLFDEKKARCSVGELPCGQAFHVFGAIGTDAPKDFRVVAVFRTGNWFAAGTMVQCGFKLERSPFADFASVFLFEVFMEASQGVLVNALLKRGEGRLGVGSRERGAEIVHRERRGTIFDGG